MQHVAIDLGGKESQICVRSSDGSVIEECRKPTAALGRYLERQPRSRVVIETCAEGFATADLAIRLGHEVRVVPAALVRALGVGARGLKNDQRDARALSEASCRLDLPSVHVPSIHSRQRKSMCGLRQVLVEARTKLINSVRGYLRTCCQRIHGRSSESFARRVREHFASEQSELPAMVERQLKAIECLTEQIQEADRALAKQALADPVCKRLMTAPGVGPVTSVRFVATLDEVGRFSDAHAVASYLGLVPGERSSSDKQRRTGLTKAGPAQMRWLLMQAAWSVMRSRGEPPLKRWALEVSKRRGKHIATVALARKLSGILFALWRDGSEFQAVRAARWPSASA